ADPPFASAPVAFASTIQTGLSPGSGSLGRCSGLNGISCLGCPLDLRAVVLPEGRVSPVQGRAPRLRSHRAVQLLAQDVSVPGVTIGLVEDVDQDVEELHVRAWPPGHMARRIDVERGDR